MKHKNLLIVIFSLSLIGCGGNNTNSEKENINSLLLENSGDALEISTESLNTIIESIPSPIEIAMVIKKSGNGFDEKLLNVQDNASLYLTDQAKAFGIGVYSGDLGYINIYEKSMLAVSYLNTIKRLADDINIGHFFDFELIRRLASNSDKMDSLIYLSTINFNKMDAFLRSQKRSRMSILMVTGTWTEGLYIATSNYRLSKNEDTKEWIGYQKIIIDQLLLGLSAYKNDSYFQKLVDDMNSLKKLYNTIQIVYEYNEPESVEIDGRLVIVDKSTSRVNITSDQVEQISELIEIMRTRLVSSL